MNVLKLDSGFEMDYGGMFAPSGLQVEDIERLADNVSDLWMATDRLVKQGMVAGHLSKDGKPEAVLFPQMPYVEKDGITSPALLQELKDLRNYGREHIDAVVSFGIGGSYLGSKVLFDVHCGEFWNCLSDEERHHYPRFFFAGHTADAQYLQGLCQTLQRFASRSKNYRVLLVINSKSGSTIEPMANFMVLEAYLKDQEIDYEVIAVTDNNASQPTVLYQMAQENGWRTYNVPNGIGGRFSVFTEVGLVTAALIGFDIEAFLEGARSMNEACQIRSIWKNPALLSAAMKYIGAEVYGRTIEVFMPYRASLRSLSDWYVQLLAESLGKHREDGSLYGRTPVAAVGSMDMHAQVQEHQEGRLNKVVQFIKIMDLGADCLVPQTYEAYDCLAKFTHVGMNDILNTALDSNREALSSDDRMNMTVQIPRLDAFYLGQLMFMYFWAIFFEAQLAGVDAFDQPGVEVYKRLLGPKLETIKQQRMK